ncbi:MAG: hypothetical protein H6619_06330 [Deltaproteobacteria bacterium]|nr:hypothetical protein [Deltaproteobacteria bacterium]
MKVRARLISAIVVIVTACCSSTLYAAEKPQTEKLISSALVPVLIAASETISQILEPSVLQMIAQIDQVTNNLQSGDLSGLLGSLPIPSNIQAILQLQDSILGNLEQLSELQSLQGVLNFADQYSSFNISQFTDINALAQMYGAGYATTLLNLQQNGITSVTDILGNIQNDPLDVNSLSNISNQIESMLNSGAINQAQLDMLLQQATGITGGQVGNLIVHVNSLTELSQYNNQFSGALSNVEAIVSTQGINSGVTELFNLQGSLNAEINSLSAQSNSLIGQIGSLQAILNAQSASLTPTEITTIQNQIDALTTQQLEISTLTGHLTGQLNSVNSFIQTAQSLPAAAPQQLLDLLSQTQSSVIGENAIFQAGISQITSQISELSSLQSQFQNISGILNGAIDPLSLSSEDLVGLLSITGEIDGTIASITGELKGLVSFDGILQTFQADLGNVIGSLNINGIAGLVDLNNLTSQIGVLQGGIAGQLGAITSQIGSLNGLIDSVTGQIGGLLDPIQSAFGDILGNFGFIDGQLDQLIDQVLGSGLVDQALSQVTSFIDSGPLGDLLGPIKDIFGPLFDLFSAKAPATASAKNSKKLKKQAQKCERLSTKAEKRYALGRKISKKQQKKLVKCEAKKIEYQYSQDPWLTYQELSRPLDPLGLNRSFEERLHEIEALL